MQELLKDERKLIAILLAIYLITRLPVLNYLPFVKDEALYAMMAFEQAAHPSIVPTFLGYPVSWKPAPFFWLLSLFAGLPLPPELGFRLPSFLAGLATIPLVYAILRNCGATNAISFFSVLIFTLSLPSLYPNGAILIDSLNFLIICGSLFLYTEKNLPETRFLPAGCLGFLAFFTKFTVAFMIPALALAFIFFNERRKLSSPLFLLSLGAVPAAFLAQLALMDSAGLAGEFIALNIVERVVSPGGFEVQLGIFTGSISIFLMGAGLWFALSLAGAFMHWRGYPVMSAWYLLTVFPLLSGSRMIWYYLPVMPAVSFFAAMVLLRWGRTDKIDLFFWLFFSAIVIISMSYIALLYNGMHWDYSPERDAGMLIAGKENVLIIGNYAPSIPAYKTLAELRASGRALDYGYITSGRPMKDEEMREFLQDYRSTRLPATDGSFTSFFTAPGIYRKDTNITEFDYIVISGSFNVTLPPGARMIFNSTSRDIAVYEMNPMQ